MRETTERAPLPTALSTFRGFPDRSTVPAFDVYQPTTEWTNVSLPQAGVRYCRSAEQEGIASKPYRLPLLPYGFEAGSGLDDGLPVALALFHQRNHRIAQPWATLGIRRSVDGAGGGRKRPGARRVGVVDL